MLSLLFIFSISVAQAGDIVSLEHKNDACIKAAQDFLGARDTHPRIVTWKYLEDLNCGGLTYVDGVLKLLLSQRFIWSADQDRGPLLLGKLPLAISRINVLSTGFFSSDLRASIHYSAQKLLQKFERNKALRAPIINIYNRLHLWDETDMPDIMAEYFTNQEMSGILIEMVSKAAPETKREFARRVHVRFSRRDLVDLMLLYRIKQTTDDQLSYLVQLLMEDSEYQLKNPDQFIYGENWRPVKELRSEVLRSLSARLIAGDTAVLAAFNEVYNSLPSYTIVRRDSQTAAYRKFLLRLKSGFFPESCEPKLDTVSTGPGDLAG